MDKLPPQIQFTVSTIIVQYLGVDLNQIHAKAKIVDDLGADSLDVIELIMAFEEELDIDIPDKDLDGMLTVEDITHYLEGRANA